MLQMRPGCECCDKDLPANSVDAVVCSFECTFCVSCAMRLEGKCPNCGGDFAPRPTRARTLWSKYPASTERVHKPDSCRKAG
jgi:hypothetical protein